MEKKRVGIIGGGIIGLSSAYFLKKAGHDVFIIDQTDMQDGCSYGNAGMVVPSHFIPLATPGMMSKGIRWMFNSESPFYIKPRMNWDLARWGWLFFRSSTAKHVSESALLLKTLNEQSRLLFESIISDHQLNCTYENKGILILCNTDHALEEEIQVAEQGKTLGLTVDILQADQVSKVEPLLSGTSLGGVHYRCDSTLTPTLFMEGLKAVLKSSGVEFIHDQEIVTFEWATTSITQAKSLTQSFSADEWVIATGSWSPRLSAQLGLRLPLQPGKGYSFMVNSPKVKPSVPSILIEARVAITPMGEHVRMAGTMELAGFDGTVHMGRVKGISSSVADYYPNWSVDLPDQKDVWFGYRPVSPDGLPFIGKLNRLKNVTLATGHAMMGFSLGPITGKLVSDLIEGKSPEISLEKLSPERFG